MFSKEQAIIWREPADAVLFGEDEMIHRNSRATMGL